MDRLSARCKSHNGDRQIVLPRGSPDLAGLFAAGAYLQSVNSQGVHGEGQKQAG
jgi:hypothetical protein